MVVLVDADTQSYAEVFAGSLQASRQARIVGSRTAGNTETVFGYDFADKSRLWIAQEGFRLPSGVNLEGRGVVPDVALAAAWESFDEAHDPFVLQARALLEH